MTTEAATIEIACAKPGCHWRGSPADAPGHPCPTPRTLEGMTQAEALDAAAEQAEPRNPFAGMIDADGNVIPDVEPEQTVPEGPKATDEPTDAAGISAWLLEHGEYDDVGVPLDEKTARLDARLTGLVAEQEEPELDELMDTLTGEPVEPGVIPPEATSTPDPTRMTERAAADPAPEPGPGIDVGGPAGARALVHARELAAELNAQTAVASYRWAVVRVPADGVATLIGRGKTRADANEIADNVQAGDDAQTVVLRSQDVFDRALELDELAAAPVDDPATPGEELDDAEPDPEPSVEEEKQEPPPADPTGEALFDREAYDREDLAIPKVDGQQIDRIAVNFTGEIMLDRSDPEHVALYNRLILGGNVDLRIAGEITGTGAKRATARDGDLDVVVGRKTIKIDHVTIAAGDL